MSCGLSCTICCERYKSTDEIYSTSCGHIFHLQCMMQWKSRSTSCPQCRAYNPESHKIYLNIEDNKENEEKLLNLKKQLQEQEQCVSNLEQKLEECDFDIKKQLEEKVLQISSLEHQLEQSESNFFELQKQCCNYDEEIAKLNNTIKYLKIQNEGQEKDILLKIKESSKLREELQRNAATLANADMAVSEMALMQKNKVLQQKLEQMSEHLEMEMRNSVELSLEKAKLENLLKQRDSRAPNNNNNKHNRMIRSYASDCNLANANSLNQVKGGNNVKQSAKTARTDGPIANANNNRSIVIKNIPKMSPQTSFTSIVTKLAQKMNVVCEESDIEKTFILQKNFYIQPDTFSLVVEFKTLDIKMQFLANNEKLRNYPATCQIIIYAYINENANPLFYYAKTLRQFGYKFVFCKNGGVFVRKSIHSPIIKIRNTQHVDELKQEHGKEQDQDTF